MSASAMPFPLIASTTLTMAALAFAWASAALGAWAWTPMVIVARSGLIVTLPVPLTVMPWTLELVGTVAALAGSAGRQLVRMTPRIMTAMSEMVATTAVRPSMVRDGDTGECLLVLV